MKLHSIETGFFKLDGGAMFGVVPKTIWQKLNPSDENNLCNWAMRCLLVEHQNRLILIDNGIGDKQDEKFFSHYYLNGDQNLKSSLKEKGFHPEDITDVFLTHLHFDHCGGSVEWNENKNGYRLAFPNAKYWSHKNHWNMAVNHPNPREKASFLKENLIPVQESGHLNLLDDSGKFMDGFSFITSNGHTESMMVPVLDYNGKKLIYMADLIPSSYHIPVPYVMGYDMLPAETMKEKSEVLQKAADEKHILFFEHDPLTECCTVSLTEKGIRKAESFKLSEI